ncbi:hypothetical protein EC991_007662, partial [Linnemannia zychae]
MTNDFRDIEADKIILWHASILNDDNRVSIQLEAVSTEDKKNLGATYKNFQRSSLRNPPNQRFHIIVKIPLPIIQSNK